MTPQRPDLDLLAELDAGLLDPDRAAQVRAAAAADSHAAAVLDALTATRAELAALPAPALPPEIAARWTAALQAEGAAAGAPAVATGPADAGPSRAGPEASDGAAPPIRGSRPPRRADPMRPATRSLRRRRWSAAGTAALLAAVLVAGVLSTRPDPLPSLDRVDLAATGLAAVGTTDAGDLTDPHRRSACLGRVAPEIPPDAPLLGGRRVLLDGREAVLLVLASGRLGVFHIAVVDPRCGPGGGTLLGSAVVGG